MKIVKNHFTPGAKVENYAQIKDVAQEMIELLSKGLPLLGVKTQGYALAHNQVEDKKPLAFFVFSGETCVNQNWPSQIIINPQIIEPPRMINIGTEETPDWRSNLVTYEESCFSFPHRRAKRVNRHFQITVRYQMPDKKGNLNDVEETLEALKAHIFQHEWQHTIGENIFYPKPVK